MNVSNFSYLVGSLIKIEEDVYNGAIGNINYKANYGYGYGYTTTGNTKQITGTILGYTALDHDILLAVMIEGGSVIQVSITRVFFNEVEMTTRLVAAGITTFK